MKLLNKLKISYVNLGLQFSSEKNLLLPKLDKLLSSGNYILSEEVDKFEFNIKKYHSSKYCVSVNSGTDALILSLLALDIGPGDEVITQANSYIASAASINAVGAKPIFVDVLKDQTMDPNSLKKKITRKTKVIMPVHLTGRMCDMESIMKIARKNKIKVIEDSAQSIGASFNKRKSGTFGECSAFSTHPLKNLNACGDGGFVVTNNKKIYNFISLKRNHGHFSRDKINFWGTVSRLDSIQAVILNFRLKKLENVIKRRIQNATYYKKNLDCSNIFFPQTRKNCRDTYHLFVIQTEKRDELKEFLNRNNIETKIHYPVPIHKQIFFKKQFGKIVLKETESQSKKILSLPINQFLEKKEIKKICDCINYFFKNMS